MTIACYPDGDDPEGERTGGGSGGVGRLPGPENYAGGPGRQTDSHDGQTGQCTGSTR